MQFSEDGPKWAETGWCCIENTPACGKAASREGTTTLQKKGEGATGEAGTEADELGHAVPLVGFNEAVVYLARVTSETTPTTIPGDSDHLPRRDRHQCS